MKNTTNTKDLTYEEKLAILRSPIQINVVGGRSWGGTSRFTKDNDTVMSHHRSGPDESYLHTSRIDHE